MLFVQFHLQKKVTFTFILGSNNFFQAKGKDQLKVVN